MIQKHNLDKNMSIEQAILKIVREIFSDNEVELDTELYESGIVDSMGLVQLLATIENDLGCYIPITDINRAEIFSPRHFANIVVANQP